MIQAANLAINRDRTRKFKLFLTNQASLTRFDIIKTINYTPISAFLRKFAS